VEGSAAPDNKVVTSRMRKLVKSILNCLVFVLSLLLPVRGQAQSKSVIVVDMDMMILPGTQQHFTEALQFAEAQNAGLVVVRLNTPGGMLSTTQSMIEDIFQSKIPVAVLVGPTGGTATSAGVFLTLAAHVAAMEPGTSIGAAHPVAGDGKDIEGDMRAKAENMAAAMVKAISEQRGRNVAWAEEAVKQSSSITEREALQRGVVDMIAHDIPDLLQQLRGRTVTLGREEHVIGDLSGSHYIHLPISVKNQAVNVLANPSVAALLWLGASTGIAAELYHPGLIFPGVLGTICLILALAVTQIIPLNTGGILLIMLGGILLGAELYLASGILGAGGVLSLLLGIIYLVDISVAPDLHVAYAVVVPLALVLSVAVGLVAWKVRQTFSQRKLTGMDLLTGREGKWLTDRGLEGKVLVAGEIWRAKSTSGDVPKGARVIVQRVVPGLVAEVSLKTVKDSD
jgi:membrane-bound serine protease (ClpP class)